MCSADLYFLQSDIFQFPIGLVFVRLILLYNHEFDLAEGMAVVHLETVAVGDCTQGQVVGVHQVGEGVSAADGDGRSSPLSADCHCRVFRRTRDSCISVSNSVKIKRAVPVCKRSSVVDGVVVAFSAFISVQQWISPVKEVVRACLRSEQQIFRAFSEVSPFGFGHGTAHLSC